MPTKIIFPYQFKVIKNERIADPIIYLNVVTKLGLRKIGFLVDSGADIITLPLTTYLFWFDFKPDERTATTLGGVEGKGVMAYPSKISLLIGKEEFTVRCCFVKSNTFPLLGRLDIWDKFNLAFDNLKKQVVFEKI